MTSTTKAPPLYPKTHIIAASGVAALLSLALLVFPSREVEAKKTFLNLDMDNGAEQAQQNLQSNQDAAAQQDLDSPFTQIEGNDESQNAELDAEPEIAEQPPEDPRNKTVTVANGDTLSTVFSKVGLSSNTLHEVINSSKEAKQLSRLKVGQELQFQLSEEGQLESLHSQLSDLESISLSKTDSGYDFKREMVKPDVHESYAHGVINSSLFVAAKRAGLSHNLTMDLANIFGYDIDFAMDIREGDEFEVIYQNKKVGDKSVGTGNILSARFTNRGKTYTAVRYTDKQGNVSYYDADGNSMRKAFIRTPVDFARISSRFSMGRKHPILNKIRAHKGVD